MAQQSAAEAPLPSRGINKWEVLRELGVARKALGVSDRELVVLQALLSFHPGNILGGNEGGLVIHPSNASICARLNGMPCSTMRRHVARLVQAGLLRRRDSPNGKRFARRYGGEKEVFGFCLSPLLRRHDEVCALAEAVRADEERLTRLRQRVSLMLRDLAGLADYGHRTHPEQSGLWDRLSDLSRLRARALRRQLSTHDLETIEEEAIAGLEEARAVLEGAEKQMSTKDVHFGHHHQNSNEDSYDLEPCLEKAEGEVAPGNSTARFARDAETDQTDTLTSTSSDPAAQSDKPLPSIPLQLVLRACGELRTYIPDRIGHWHQLVLAADRLRPMMGISPSAWIEAKEEMGPEEASVVVLAMLERMEDIRSPGGYLRHLTQKASSGAFSSGPMVMALLQREAA